MRGLVIILFLHFFSVNLLLAQDKEVLSESVKISKNDLRVKENYLYHLKNSERITDFVNLKVVKRYSNRTFVVKVEKEPPVGVNPQGDFYRIDPRWKLSPHLKDSPPKEPLLLVVSTTDINAFKENFSNQILQQYENFLVVKATPQDFEKLLNSPSILHISRFIAPQEEAPVTSLDFSVNQINRLHHLFPEIRGETTSVSIKELLFDTTDIDIRNRIDLVGTEANKVDQHATLIATLIAGAGNSGFTGAGIAPRASISSSSFLNIFPDSMEMFRAHDIFVQNHSYGTALEAEYGIEAAAYDKQVYDLPELVHVFSSGNSGFETPEEGRYEGVEGYSNLTGNFKMAKNIITVGAVDAGKQPVSRSSKGPAHDGRLKPELVAYALAGTSDAAAMVSGTVLLLQDLYRKKEGHLPTAALVKAALVAGAEDVGPEGIDFTTGYGNLNAVKSMEILNTHSFLEGKAHINSSQKFSVNIPAGTEEFKLVLSWTDIAGNPGDELALVNDLDLVLISPSGERWNPWVLDSSPHALEEKAVRARDSLNPIEMITLDSPDAGEYTIEVTAKHLSADQKFFLAYMSSPDSTFTWTYPTGSDALLLEKENVVRWETNLATQNGVLEYRINESEWIVIDSPISIGSEKHAWMPMESGKAQLKFTLGADEYLSDIFSISPEIKPQVLFNCTNTLKISWEAVNGASEYHIQNLQDQYMETLFSTDNTSTEISKNVLASNYLSVVPVFGEISGRRGVTIDYEVQGVQCYYRNFFAFLSEEPKVEAVLNLSTTSGIAEVQFKKKYEGEVIILDSFTPPFSDLQLTVEDLLVQPGLNIYSTTIVLNDGSEVDTDPVEFLLPGEETFTIYPNPIRSGESLHIISKGDGLDFEVFDLQGRRIRADQLLRFNDRIEMNVYSPGVYLIRARRNGRTVGVRKLISL